VAARTRIEPGTGENGTPLLGVAFTSNQVCEGRERMAAGDLGERKYRGGLFTDLVAAMRDEKRHSLGLEVVREFSLAGQLDDAMAAVLTF
jgi:hypothetical protein